MNRPEQCVRSERRAWPERRGMVLLVVMIIVLLIALAGYGFSYQMRTAYVESRLAREQAESRLAAWSGVEFAAAVLKVSPQQRSAAGGVESNAALFAGRSVAADDAGDDRSPTWRFSILAPAEAVAGNSQMEAESFRLGMENESAKLHLPTLLAWNRIQPGAAKVALMNLPGATEAMVDALIAMQETRLAAFQSDLDCSAPLFMASTPGQTSIGTTFSNGPAGLAGTKQIGSLGRPSLLDSVASARAQATGGGSQLREVWQGSDLNQNYRLDPLEKSLSGSAEQGLRAWRQLLTCCQGQRNETWDGRPCIYLNNPELSDLHRQLSERWPVEWANYVIAYRQYGPAASTSAPNLVSQAARASTSPASNASSAKSVPVIPLSEWTPDLSVAPKFSIRNPMELVGRGVEVVHRDGGRGRLNSPFADDNGGYGEYLARLLDEATVIPGPCVTGKVDILHAPREVLLAIPGMEPGTVDRILTARQGDGASREGRQSAAWLLLEGIVDRATFARLHAWCGSRSDVYTAQCVGFRDPRSPLFRCTVTLDGKRGPVQVRDFQRWNGWDSGFAISELEGVERDRPMREKRR